MIKKKTPATRKKTSKKTKRSKSQSGPDVILTLK